MCLLIKENGQNILSFLTLKVTFSKLGKTGEHYLIRTGDWKKESIAFNCSFDTSPDVKFKVADVYGHFLCAESQATDASDTEMDKTRGPPSPDSQHIRE